MPGGSVTVLQPEPLLPADELMKIPWASEFSTIVFMTFGAQSSPACGQPQLLFITCGRFVGSAFWP
jgi:hypothetical protein